MNWRESLVFPDDQPISREAEDLIRRLICEPENRLGRNGVAEIKAHPFFYGVNWQGIRDEPSPHVPQLRSITDTSYFPTEELDTIPDAVDGANLGKEKTSFHICELQNLIVFFWLWIGYTMDNVNTQKDLAFVGYTFKRFDYLTKKNIL